MNGFEGLSSSFDRPLKQAFDEEFGEGQVEENCGYRRHGERSEHQPKIGAILAEQKRGGQGDSLHGIRLNKDQREPEIVPNWDEHYNRQNGNWR